MIIIILRKPVGVHYWGPDDKNQHRRGPSFGVYYKKSSIRHSSAGLTKNNGSDHTRGVLVITTVMIVLVIAVTEVKEG